KTSPGKGSFTSSSMNAFSGRNKYQAAPHTSRNTASSTAKSVRRIMGLPPTRLGAFCRPPHISWMPCRKEGYSRLANHREPMARLRAAGRNKRRAVGVFTAGRSRAPGTGAKDGLDKLFGRVAGRRSVLGRGERGPRQLHSLLVTVEVRDAPR